MSDRFIAGEQKVWSTFTREVKIARRADVAVAYFGQGSAKRLPLPLGSRLVVDASMSTVRSGATCPEELLKMVERGVDVYSRPGLHAKVYVFGRTAFIGSANVSAASADRLVEAMIRTTDNVAVNAAKQFVIEMAATSPLGPDALKLLQKHYRPPRVARANETTKQAVQPTVWIERVDSDDYPEGSERFVEKLLKEAKLRRHHNRGFELCETWRRSPPKYVLNDTLIMTSDDGAGEMVSPPARVIHVKTWANGKSTTTFTVVEHPQLRRISVTRLAKSLGRGWRQRLLKNGKMKRQHASVLIAWWNERMYGYAYDRHFRIRPRIPDCKGLARMRLDRQFSEGLRSYVLPRLISTPVIRTRHAAEVG